MRKIVLPTLLLLGAQHSLAKSPIKKVLAQDYDYDTEPTPPTPNTTDYIEEHFDEDYQFYFKKITQFSKEEITKFWVNKTDGEKCTSLFIEIYDKFESLKVTVEDIKVKIEQYNTECSDKCLPGYVKCEGDNSDKCVLECDCCALHYKNCCSGKDNHPYDTHNYASGDGEVLYCYDWCCDDDETYCHNDCQPDNNLGNGYGPAGPYTYQDEYGHTQTSQYPKFCCVGADCCDAGQIYLDYMTNGIPFCCVAGEVLDKDHGKCCCEDKDATCCPDLYDHCQPKSNHLCCDLDNEIYCNGQCWPKNKPCCDTSAGEYNCQYQYDKCVTYCCCDDDHECCEKRKTCQPKGDLCCEEDEKDCYGKCIPKEDHCCPDGESWCEYTQQCSKYCCQVGWDWCEWTYKCEQNGHCCQHYYTYCEYTGKCVSDDELCCPTDTPYCKYTHTCAKHCCQYDQTKHEVWCDIHYECRDECDCCNDGYEACKCQSGAYDTDTTCYNSNGKECCKDYWCEDAKKCVADQEACCVANGNSYVGPDNEYYNDKYCCPYGDNYYSQGVKEEYHVVGCCKYDSYHPEKSDCCRAPHDDEKSVDFNPATGYCDITKKPPCPCEGCCDFNCCDELDYFMHKAYLDAYKQDYDSFIDFYADWYAEFYSWWHSPQGGEYNSGSSPY